MIHLEGWEWGGGGGGTFISGRLIIGCVPFLVTSRLAYYWEGGGKRKAAVYGIMSKGNIRNFQKSFDDYMNIW